MKIKNKNRVARDNIDDLVEITIVSNPSNKEEVIINVNSNSDELLKKGLSNLKLVSKDITSKEHNSKIKIEEVEKLLINKDNIGNKEVLLEMDQFELSSNKDISSLILGKEPSEDKSKLEYDIKYVKQENTIDFNDKSNNFIFGSVSAEKINSNLKERLTDSFSESELLGNNESINSNLITNKFKKNKLEEFISGKLSNNKNKKEYSLISKDELLNGIRSKGSKDRPIIDVIKTKKKNNKKIFRSSVNSAILNKELEAEIYSASGKKIAINNITKEKTELIPFEKILFFKDNSFIPNISTGYISKNRVLINITNLNKGIKSFKIFRRKISSKYLEDEYIEIANIINNNLNSYSIDDIINDTFTYKYIVTINNSSLYNFSLLKQKSIPNLINEPFIYAYQDSGSVVINIRNISNNIRKILVYRVSSIEEEKLVNGVNLLSQSNRDICIKDIPLSIEQDIEYRIVAIDYYGIKTVYNDRPQIHYNLNTAFENGRVIGLNSRNINNSIGLECECIINNMYVANSISELTNPTSDTIDAATRNQNIAKLLIRRINLEKEEDEIIYNENINPGITKFDHEILSDNKIKVYIKDDESTSSIFGYNSITSKSTYIYIARIIIYPLGIELRKNVNNFKTIAGIKENDRLKYLYDPSIFDHPLKRELGIIPNLGNKNYLEADKFGTSSSASISEIKTSIIDSTSAINLSNEIAIDTNFALVNILKIKVSRKIINEADHAQIEVIYDSISKIDIIDRIFLDKESIEYYDYRIFDLITDSIKYRVKVIGKNLEQIYLSESVEINLKDKNIEELKLKYLG